MNHDNNQPCKTCPYRKDAPVGLWSQEEFDNLIRHDQDEFGGAIFACHQTGRLPRAERQTCVGWLLDQKRRGVPSIQLRLKLMRTPAMVEQLDRVSDAGLRLYRSIEEMVRANRGKPFPRKKRGTR